MHLHYPKKHKSVTRSWFSYIGANKHHRQRKFVRRSTKRSIVQSTCKMSRGWTMRRELRSFRFRRESSKSSKRLKSDGLKLRRYRNRCLFPDLGFVCWDRVGFRWIACKSSKYNPLVVTRVARGVVSFCDVGFQLLVSCVDFQLLVSCVGFQSALPHHKKAHKFVRRYWFHSMVFIALGCILVTIG